LGPVGLNKRVFRNWLGIRQVGATLHSNISNKNNVTRAC
jgi:hypothetical protein